MSKIGLGGGCHWCTEAVYQAMYGVDKVEQGWIATGESEYSEAVIVNYHPNAVTLRNLIWVHLKTHSSQAAHGMRDKYRSAVYYFDDGKQAREILDDLQSEFTLPLITKALEFGSFKLNEERYRDYYFRDPNKPFCNRHIEPKLNWLVEEYPELVNPDVLPILSDESIIRLLGDIPLGYSQGTYKHRTYGVQKSEFNRGKSTKLLARELGGRDIISTNIYQTKSKLLVKPCEMPLQKVLAFLRDVKICNTAEGAV